MKKALLVTFTLTTRVVVDEEADYVQIAQACTPNILAKINNDELKENIEYIMRDTEMPYEPRRIQVGGSHGVIRVDEDGVVIPSRWDVPDQYANIVKIDVPEYEKYWGEQIPTSVDILNVGYWHKNSKGIVEYESPEPDWREEIKLMRSEQEL